jgi:hypothetical protein
MKSLSIILLLIVIFIGLFAYFSNMNTKPETVSTRTANTYTLQYLEEQNGLNQKPCYVAVGQKIYDATPMKEQIAQLSAMNPSAPKIECGKKIDTSKTINMPDISQFLKEVGTLEK